MQLVSWFPLNLAVGLNKKLVDLSLVPAGKKNILPKKKIRQNEVGGGDPHPKINELLLGVLSFT